MENNGKSGGGVGTVFMITAAVVLIPAFLLTVTLGYAGMRTARYNRGIVGGLFQTVKAFFLPRIRDETDALFPSMQDKVRKLKHAWDDIDKRDHEWHAAGHEDRELLMKVTFCVAFYYSDREFTDEGYEDFAWQFHNDSPMEKVCERVSREFEIDFGERELASVEAAMEIIRGGQESTVGH